MKLSDEAELLARAKSGDTSAFDALVSPLYDKLTNMCQGMLHDRDLAGQAVQEALTRAWFSIERCRDNFPGWVYKTSLNVARDMRSEAYWRRTVPLESAADPAAGDTWTDAVVWGVQLNTILSQLNSNEREIFVLHFIVGSNLKEVAEILDISHDATRQRWFRTLKSIERMLEPPSRSKAISQRGDEGPHV